MVSALISRVVILVFGTLYPAYSSYKAVKTKNVKEYVKWMMYWIVFALFTTVETFADVLVSWFPFYYELKIAFVVWLLSPATKGSSVLYRKFVHPELMKREGEIDQTLERVKTQGYSALVNVGQQGINFAVQKAAVQLGQNKMMDQLMKKSFSMGDISQQQSEVKVTYRPDAESAIPEAVDEADHTHIPVASVPPLEQNILQRGDRSTLLQGGDHAAITVPLPEPCSATTPPPSQDLMPSHSGYNLRSHEVHDAAHDDPQPTHYKHSEDLQDRDHNVIVPVLPEQKKTSTNVKASKAHTSIKNITQRPVAKRKPRSRSLGRRRGLNTKASAK